MSLPKTEPRELIDSTDAVRWAEAFVRMHGGDEGLMLTWFANAIETGRRDAQGWLKAKTEDDP